MMKKPAKTHLIYTALLAIILIGVGYETYRSSRVIESAMVRLEYVLPVMRTSNLQQVFNISDATTWNDNPGIALQMREIFRADSLIATYRKRMQSTPVDSLFYLQKQLKNDALLMCGPDTVMQKLIDSVFVIPDKLGSFYAAQYRNRCLGACEIGLDACVDFISHRMYYDCWAFPYYPFLLQNENKQKMSFDAVTGRSYPFFDEVLGAQITMNGKPVHTQKGVITLDTVFPTPGVYPIIISWTPRPLGTREHKTVTDTFRLHVGRR